MIFLFLTTIYFFSSDKKKCEKHLKKCSPNIFETVRTFQTDWVHKAKKEQQSQVDIDIGMLGRNLQTVMRLI